MTEILYHSFECPECGSREWGTSNASKVFELSGGLVEVKSDQFAEAVEIAIGKFVEAIDVDWDEEAEC